jgi:hypothetical protein
MRLPEDEPPMESWPKRIIDWWWNTMNIEADEERQAWWVGLAIVGTFIAINPFSGMVFSWGTAFAYEKPGFRWFPLFGTIAGIIIELLTDGKGLVSMGSYHDRSAN